MKLKRLSVATPSSSARMIALCADPARAGHQPARLRRSARRLVERASGSRKSADQKYETASTASAYGPRSSCDEQAAEHVAHDERERAAAVHERVRLHVVGRAARSSGSSRRTRRRRRRSACRSGTRRRRAASSRGARTRTRSGSTRSAGRGRRRSSSITCRRPPRRSTQAARVQREDQVRDQVQRSSARPSARRSRRVRARRSAAARVAVTWSPSSDTDCPMKKRRKLRFSRRRGGITASAPRAR